MTYISSAILCINEPFSIRNKYCAYCVVLKLCNSAHPCCKFLFTSCLPFLLLPPFPCGFVFRHFMLTWSIDPGTNDIFPRQYHAVQRNQQKYVPCIICERANYQGKHAKCYNVPIIFHKSTRIQVCTSVYQIPTRRVCGSCSHKEINIS